MDVWFIAVLAIALLIVIIAAYATWRGIQSRKSGFPLEDERTRRIQGKASQATLILVFYYLIALNFYNIINIEFLGGIQLESMLVINSTLIIGGCMVLGLRYYFGRKEDA
jgi:uncharacterized membrane protein